MLSSRNVTYPVMMLSTSRGNRERCADSQRLSKNGIIPWGQVMTGA
jgi:hypothetical protein